MTRSLRLRLIVWILALLLPVSVAAGWLLVWAFGGRLLRDIDIALEEEAVTVASLLEKPASGDTMDTLLAHVSTETDLGTGKRIVVRRRGHVIGEAPAGAAAFLGSHAPPAVRIATYDAGPPDDPLTVVIGVPAMAAVHATQRLTLLLVVGIPCGLLVLAAGLWVVTGRALRPLEQASRRMEAIGVADLDARVPIENPHDEVGRMVLALNRMLDRLAHAVAEMQRFTADASHELRTPLTVLRTGLEIALARDRSALEYRAALADALRGTESLAQLAEDLLTLARLEALAPAQAAAPVDLGELLQDLADAWTPRTAQHGVAIDLSTGPHVAVEGRAADLYRLFNNLIENAVLHSPRGGHLRLEAQAEHEWARVTVTDDGPGIAAQDAERVFDRFYRGRSERNGGTGLGLSIAQAIARAHGGQVSLRNRVGGGCGATVLLPLTPRAGAER